VSSAAVAAQAQERPAPHDPPPPAAAPHTPTRDEFRRLARRGNLIPVYREILADMETPVSAFKRIAHRPNAFLLESVEGGERLARYSFLGADPHLVFASKGDVATVTGRDGTVREVRLAPGRDPLHVLEELLREVRYVSLPDLPRFVGGAVGYIGYDWVRFLEPIGEATDDDLDIDDCRCCSPTRSASSTTSGTRSRCSPTPAWTASTRPIGPTTRRSRASTRSWKRSGSHARRTRPAPPSRRPRSRPSASCRT
jgi:anthranilate/para-aminobenzoate synthase component I